MTDFLPLFPLKLVLYPGEQLNLHIFEPRYRQLFRECEENGITFGLPAFINNQVMEFGTEARLKRVVKRYDSGELDVETEGMGVFRMENFFRVAPNKLYAGADIVRLDDFDDRDPYLNERIIRLLEELYDALHINRKVPDEPEKMYTFEYAHHVGFSLQQEYDFLCIQSERERQLFMIQHIEKLIPTVQQLEQMRKKAQLNGHFKQIIPPEF